ncbi:urease accessory protein UreF, partial [Thiohalomonas denitrificans]|uniref:urease accessory protein UreF n=1 Tax=Thiohalomonas denitrificans TaxID=415747 RepID=UPI0026EE90F0
TAELRAEERARGKAMTSLLVQLEVAGAAELRETLRLCQAAGFALAASRWGVSLEEAATGYAWTWLENLVLAGVKLIPLGQTAGQRLSLALGAKIPAAVNHGLGLADPAIGASAPAAALASSLHETQYTRLFRS